MRYPTDNRVQRSLSSCDSKTVLFFYNPIRYIPIDNNFTDNSGNYTHGKIIANNEEKTVPYTLHIDESTNLNLTAVSPQIDNESYQRIWYTGNYAIQSFWEHGGEPVGNFQSYSTTITNQDDGTTFKSNLTQAPATTSGNLTSGETWFSEVTLTGNITVPVGVTLTITPDATVNLKPDGSQFYIKSTGGTIINGGTINGLVATLSNGSLFSSLPVALSSTSSGQTVQMVGSENVTSNCSVPSGVTLSIASGVTLTFGSGNSLNIIGGGILSAIGATFQGNGSRGSWYAIYHYANSSGSIQNSTIKDAQCGILVQTGAHVTSSGNTITNSNYGISAPNNGQVTITNCTISNNVTGINLNNSSTASITGCDISNNSSYGIHAEHVNANYPWEQNTLEGNNGYAMFLNNTSPILLNNMITGNAHGIVISSSSPSFGYRAGGSGYNAITCATTPLFLVENYSDVYAGTD